MMNSVHIKRNKEKLTEMELKVLITTIPELKATWTTWTTKVETSRETPGESEVESLEWIGSGLIGLLAGVFSTVILRATLFKSQTLHSPTLIRQGLIRLCNLLELLFSFFLILLLLISFLSPLLHVCLDATLTQAFGTPS